MYRKYSPYIIVGLAIVPILWIISRAVELHFHQLGPADKLHLIARRQGWQFTNVQTLYRVWDGLETNKEPSDDDWQTLIRAADQETNGYGFEDNLIDMFAFSRISDKYKNTIIKWSERNMEQTNDPWAAVIGYFGYIRADGPERTVWANRLTARDPRFAIELAKKEKIAEKIANKLRINTNSIYVQ